MRALIAAGKSLNPKADEVLLPLANGKPRALMPLAGRPMVQWLLDAMRDAESIEGVTLVGLREPSALGCGDKPLDFLPDEGSLVANLVKGMTTIRYWHPGTRHVLVTGADVPLVTAAMVDWLADCARDDGADAFLALIAEATLAERFPQANPVARFRFRGGRWAVGDLSVARTNLLDNLRPALKSRLMSDAVLRRVALTGMWPVALAATGLLSREGFRRMASRRLGIQLRLLDAPYAEMAVDVDRPGQLEAVRRELENRGESK